METPAQKLVKRMQEIADQPEPLEQSMKRMRDFYETNSFHPPVDPSLNGYDPPTDSAGDLLEGKEYEDYMRETFPGWEPEQDDG